VVVTVPNEYLGNVTGDISSRRGMILDSEDRDPVKIVTCEVPLSELFGYTTSLRGMSQGRASNTMEFLEYRPMPAAMQKAMLEEQQGGKAKK
jgi:elongation factor G